MVSGRFKSMYLNFRTRSCGETSDYCGRGHFEPGPRFGTGTLLALASLFGLWGSTLLLGQPKNPSCCASGEDAALRATEFVLVDDHNVPIARLGAGAGGVGVEILDSKSSRTRLWLGLGGDGPCPTPQLIMFGETGEAMITMEMEDTSIGDLSTLRFGRPGSSFVVLTGGHNLDGQLVLRSSVPLESPGLDGQRIFPAARISHSGVDKNGTSSEHQNTRSDAK